MRRVTILSPSNSVRSNRLPSSDFHYHFKRWVLTTFRSYDLFYGMMKCFFSAVAISVTLLFPSVGWGNVDGNGVICERITERNRHPYPKFFIFENGVVQHNAITVSNDVIIATNGKTFPYTTTPSTISWVTPLVSNDGFISYTLNRENLSLKLVYKGIVKISECDVFPKEILTEKVDALMKYFQSEYDNLRKNNKI